MKRFFIFELLIITFVGTIYFFLHAPSLPQPDPLPPTLDLRPFAHLLTDDTIRSSGLEHERLAGTILPIRIGLERYGHIPTWNSLLSNGVPLTNNAFSYFFNPFHSLPVLILGGITGSKVATLIALLIAGYSMWLFGYAIGLGAVARIVIGLLYLMNGSIVAKFGAGHFQLACSLAWPPLVLATLWWTLHSPRRIAPVAVGISFALLFYAGNIYYVLHTAICCLVIVALHLIDRTENRWHIRWDRLRRAGLAAVFAFGLMALQFFPIWQTHDFVTHESQGISPVGTLENNYDLNQSFANLTQPWSDWYYQRPANLFEAVDYAYLGNGVFILIGLGLALLIVQRRPKWRPSNQKRFARVIIAALVLALVMMLWAGGQVQPLPWLYAQIPLLSQFRFLGRALAIANLWWILLAGIALDMLWNTIRNFSASTTTSRPHVRRRLIIALSVGIFAWIFLLIYSASSGSDRILMVMRNVTWWLLLDTLRYTSLPNALHGLLTLIVLIVLLDWLISLVQNRIRKQGHPISRYIAGLIQIGFLAGIAFGIFDIMMSNVAVPLFTIDGVPFDTIYDNLHLVDTNAPFPSVILPFSPFTFDAYEHEVRIWSLDEGWRPAAISNPSLLMHALTNYPRWLIANRNADGTLQFDSVQQLIQAAGYQLRACYATDFTALVLTNCSIHQQGFNLYEFPQALPYAFLVSDPVITNSAGELHADQVGNVDILLYQQDSMVIHVADNLPDFYQHYLVVQETNFPGWQATIDGQPVQTITVPTYFIAGQPLGLIAIPTQKGDHTYTLHFDPPGLTTGIVVFLGTLALIAFYLTYHRKQKSPA